MVARTSDKVQVMCTISATQSTGHDKAYAIGSIVPALAKNARTGHPQFRFGKEKQLESLGHPPTLECAAYRAELQCLAPAPKTKEIDDRRAFIKKQIQNYCGGK
jgi:hypothetical protein